MSTDIEHKLLDELLSNINQVLFVRDAFTENHDVIYVNDAYERLWGRTKNSLKENPASYIEAVHPDDREVVIGLYMKFLQGNIEYEKDYFHFIPFTFSWTHFFLLPEKPRDTSYQ